MKTLILPLDERPCNFIYPQMIAASNDTIDLVSPHPFIMGNKKQPGNVTDIQTFLQKSIVGADNAVISIDTLVYGGLIPSRLHHTSLEELLKRLEVLKTLKEINPQAKIYAFNCIMRTPQYNSAEEEPDYYADHGQNIFRRKYLQDYHARHGELSQAQAEALDAIRIPLEYIEDYEIRRDINQSINLEVLNYLEAGIIDFLVIPQDDSSPYGYTAISQQAVIAGIKEKGLDLLAMIYPGADEVALTLLARAYNDFVGQTPAIYPFYASVLGPTIIPKYEDRPMFESLKSHIRATGSRLVHSPDHADFILAINSPGKFMEETYDETLDITHNTYRNVLDFSLTIADYLAAGHKVALCDSALCNGGDIEIIQYLDQLGVLQHLTSYAGWNTNCNTLGTTLAQAIIGNTEEGRLSNLTFRVIEDVLYQAKVRHEIEAEHDFVPEIAALCKTRLQEAYDRLNIAQAHPVTIEAITHPWGRYFEIGMKLAYKN